MASRKITIAVPSDLLAFVRDRVEQGAASNVSSYFTTLVEQRREEEDISTFIAEMRAEGGTPTATDIAWASDVMRVANSA